MGWNQSISQIFPFSTLLLWQYGKTRKHPTYERKERNWKEMKRKEERFGWFYPFRTIIVQPVRTTIETCPSKFIPDNIWTRKGEILLTNFNIGEPE